MAESEEPRVSQLIAGLGEDSAALERFADGDLVDRLGRWYRVLIQELAQSPSSRQPLLAFADELLDTRRQIDRSNAANARLLMERLAYRWSRLRGL